jgi:demethoxyubiquinone hydroxylase (CLK1/Coq7/Cat5 family)
MQVMKEDEARHADNAEQAGARRCRSRFRR